MPKVFIMRGGSKGALPTRKICKSAFTFANLATDKSVRRAQYAAMIFGIRKIIASARSLKYGLSVLLRHQRAV